MTSLSNDRHGVFLVREFKGHITCLFGYLVISLITRLPATSDLRVRGSSPLERATQS